MHTANASNRVRDGSTTVTTKAKPAMMITTLNDAATTSAGATTNVG